mmetsp:Transcript_78210/g.138082  ORF Transcript_78210/g.138082 Transcript_78210/m.138082 type:complete len:236 (+) Transcript_78210:3478-4185(+)
MMRSMTCASPEILKQERNRRNASSICRPTNWKVSVNASMTCLLKSALLPKYSPICTGSSSAVLRSHAPISVSSFCTRPDSMAHATPRLAFSLKSSTAFRTCRLCWRARWKFAVSCSSLSAPRGVARGEAPQIVLRRQKDWFDKSESSGGASSRNDAGSSSSSSAAASAAAASVRTCAIQSTIDLAISVKVSRATCLICCSCDFVTQWASTCVERTLCETRLTRCSKMLTESRSQS